MNYFIKELKEQNNILTSRYPIGGLFDSTEYEILVKQEDVNENILKWFYDELKEEFNSRYSDSGKSIHIIPIDGNVGSFIDWFDDFCFDIDIVKYTPLMEPFVKEIENKKKAYDREEK